MRRIEQVNDLIRNEIGTIIDRELELAKPALITVTRVETSPDLHYADIFISVMPRSIEEETLLLMGKEIGNMQHHLNKRLRMRPVPRIKFLIDVEQKRADRIETLLAGEEIPKESSS